MAKRKGRPTKLTPKIQELVCTAIEYGAPLATAAKYGGIHEQTIGHWRKAGEEIQTRLDAGETVDLTDDEARYLDFFIAVEEANAKAMLFHLQNLTDNAHINPQNSMWMLERRWPDYFGRPRQSVELSGKDGGPVAARIEMIEVVHHADDTATGRD